MPNRLMWLMNRMKKFKEFCRKKDAQNTEVNKICYSSFRAFGDLQTAAESVKNLDKRLARFFANYFFSPPPPLPPISVLVTSLTLCDEQKIGTRWFFVKKLSFSQSDSKREQSRFWSLFVSSELPKTLPFV